MDSGSRNYRRFRDDGDEGGLVEIIASIAFGCTHRKRLVREHSLKPLK